MAQITSIDGIEFLFAPDTLYAIADRDETTNAAGTVLYGLAPQGLGLRVSESISALLQRLNLGSAFASLTRLDGSPILVNGQLVSVVRQPSPGEYGAGVNSVVFVGDLTQAVRESLDEVQQAINRAGGNL